MPVWNRLMQYNMLKAIEKAEEPYPKITLENVAEAVIMNIHVRKILRRENHV